MTTATRSARDIALTLCPDAYLDILQAADQAALRIYGNDHGGPRKVMERLDRAGASQSHIPDRGELITALEAME
jgi:hypothetical protein